jgi:hypothetical protein
MVDRHFSRIITFNKKTLTFPFFWFENKFLYAKMVAVLLHIYPLTLLQWEPTFKNVQYKCGVNTLVYPLRWASLALIMHYVSTSMKHKHTNLSLISKNIIYQT